MSLCWQWLQHFHVLFSWVPATTAELPRSHLERTTLGNRQSPNFVGLWFGVGRVPARPRQKGEVSKSAKSHPNVCRRQPQHCHGRSLTVAASRLGSRSTLKLHATLCITSVLQISPKEFHIFRYNVLLHIDRWCRMPGYNRQDLWLDTKCRWSTLDGHCKN